MGHRKKTTDASFWVFVTTLIIGLIGVSFLFGLYSGENRNFAFRAVNTVYVQLRDFFKDANKVVAIGAPGEHVQYARFEGEGVTVNSYSAGQEGFDDLIFVTGFFDDNNGARLLRRDGSVVASWELSFSRHLGEESEERTDGTVPATDWNLDTHGALILPNGSILVNYEYNGLVHLDRCDGIIWASAHPTHHSIETSQRGGFWIPGREFVAKSSETRDVLAPFTFGGAEGNFVKNDLILHVGEDGTFLESVSVFEIFENSGLLPLLTATGGLFSRNNSWWSEVVHLNKVAELSTELAAAFPMFEAGDLLISLRQRNMIAVVDPESWTIKWYKIGPWLRQHDPEFLPNGKIAVFNNGTFSTLLDADGRQPQDAQNYSAILLVDPATNEVETFFEGREDAPFLSIIRGKIDPTPKGGFLVTSHEEGRLFELDAEGEILWEYLNRYDETRALEVTEARRYPLDYFDVSDWNCGTDG